MTLMTRLADRLLGTEPKQRLRLVQCGTAMLLVLGSVVNMQYLVWAGLAPAVPTAWWTAVLMGGFAVFFITIRSGRNLRYAEPSLTVPQMVFAILCGAVGYAIAGRGRGGAFPILMVIFMFSMYSLPPATVLRTSFFAVAVFGITMLVMAHRNPAVYEPAVEWGHFIMIAIMVPAIAVLAGQLSRLRDRLRRQKKDIALALARIQELATRDELTGLINRRHMLELMEQERQRGVRSGQSFCIAVIDIDDFRHINDKHGHAFADQLLRRFANEALNAIRISDLLCRWDGKEFLLMLSNTRASLGRVSLERLRERIQALPVELQGAAMHMSFCAGVTEHHAGETVADTVQRAEHALLNAKAGGHNRVVLG
ncbi:MAG: GGDEF domain-containing protein [Rhizobacter sp.]|nr:GGDEF domain-containing protein [Rhizobacter sp.]